MCLATNMAHPFIAIAVVLFIGAVIIIAAIMDAKDYPWDEE